jgi:hypothetical protein
MGLELAGFDGAQRCRAVKPNRMALAHAHRGGTSPVLQGFCGAEFHRECNDPERSALTATPCVLIDNYDRASTHRVSGHRQHRNRPGPGHDHSQRRAANRHTPGFTLSITGTIAIMNGHRCQAGPIAIWLFIVGAGVGYSTAGLASGAHHRLVSSRSQPQPITGLSVLSVVPVLVVPVAAGAAWWIPDPRVAFATAGFVATAGYVSAFALFLHLFTRQRDRRAARSRRGAAMLRAGPTSKP